MVVYSATNRALTEVARLHRLTPTDVRILVRLAERGGEAYTNELEDDFQDWSAGSAIRRSSMVLRTAGYITADHGEGTTGTRRGLRARYVLTFTGRGVVDAFNEAVR